MSTATHGAFRVSIRGSKLKTLCFVPRTARWDTHKMQTRSSQRKGSDWHRDIIFGTSEQSPRDEKQSNPLVCTSMQTACNDMTPEGVGEVKFVIEDISLRVYAAALALTERMLQQHTELCASTSSKKKSSSTEIILRSKEGAPSDKDSVHQSGLSRSRCSIAHNSCRKWTSRLASSVFRDSYFRIRIQEWT